MKSPDKRNFAYDVLSIQNGYGLIILMGILSPANERNVNIIFIRI